MLTPRPYQEDAIDVFARHGGRGVVVLPTIDLLTQCRQSPADSLGYLLDEIGVVGGGNRSLRDLTLTTDDSAAMPHRRLVGVGLLVVDEVHRLPARACRAIAGAVNAPFRLGMSATPERSDDGHLDPDHLIGPVVYRRSPAELARDRYIANHKQKRVFVDLSFDEQMRFDQPMAQCKWCLASRRGTFGWPEAMFVEMIRRSGHDCAARAAPIIRRGRSRSAPMRKSRRSSSSSNDPVALVKMPDALSLGSGVFVSPLETIAQEIASNRWAPMSRLNDLQRDPAEVPPSLRRLSGADEILPTPGFGLCHAVWLNGLRERLMSGPIDIAKLRRDIAIEGGDGVGADALTLHFLPIHRRSKATDPGNSPIGGPPDPVHGDGLAMKRPMVSSFDPVSNESAFSPRWPPCRRRACRRGRLAARSAQ